MHLNLPIKLLILVFALSPLKLSAQEAKDTLTGKTQKTKTHFNIELSGIVPNAIGENFASEGLTFDYGLNFSFKGYFDDHIFFGLKFQHLRAEVTNTSLVGVYENSNVNSYIAEGGYRFILNDKFNIEPSLGIGLTVYNNKKTSSSFNEKTNFEDDATTFLISTAVSYKLTQHLKVFVKPEYRLDFMQIDTAPSRQNFFDQAQYLNILVGLRIGY